jgi:hypothetical protein
VNGKYRTRRGWMDHELFRREPFTRLQAWIWRNENAALPTAGACGASSCAAPPAIRRVGLGIDASPSVPESAPRREHDHNGSRNARHCHNHFVITSFISRRTAGTQHLPQRLGTLSRNATATVNAPAPGAHGALELPAAEAFEQNGNARHIERQRAGGGVTRGGASVPISTSGTMWMQGSTGRPPRKLEGQALPR